MFLCVCVCVSFSFVSFPSPWWHHHQNKHSLLRCIWSLNNKFTETQEEDEDEDEEGEEDEVKKQEEGEAIYNRAAAEKAYIEQLARVNKSGVIECALALHIFALAYKCQVRVSLSLSL